MSEPSGLIRDITLHYRLRRLVCVECGFAFPAARRDARYCSVTCRQRAHRASRQLGLLQAEETTDALGASDRVAPQDAQPLGPVASPEPTAPPSAPEPSAQPPAAAPALPPHLPQPFGSAAEIAARRCFLCGVANPCHSWGPPLVPFGRMIWGCAACRADIETPLTAGRWPTPRHRR
jgi:hypothetical protein